MNVLECTSTDMRYFAKNKVSMSLVHKKSFSFIWQVVFKLGTYFVIRGRILLLSLNELEEKSRVTITLGKFVNKPKLYSHWLIVFGKCFLLVKI